MVLSASVISFRATDFPVPVTQQKITNCTSTKTTSISGLPFFLSVFACLRHGCMWAKCTYTSLYGSHGLLIWLFMGRDLC